MESRLLVSVASGMDCTVLYCSVLHVSPQFFGNRYATSS